MLRSEHPNANTELVQPTRQFVTEIPKLRKMIVAQGLTGLANDTKWNELIGTMRSTPREVWCTSYRFRCIDSDYVSQWDSDWWYHLPFPLISVMWMELSFRDKIRQGRLLPNQIFDQLSKVESVLTSIGLDFENGADVIRIYGYSPRDRNGFLPKLDAEQVASCNH